MYNHQQPTAGSRPMTNRSTPLSHQQQRLTQQQEIDGSATISQLQVGLVPVKSPVIVPPARQIVTIHALFNKFIDEKNNDNNNNNNNNPTFSDDRDVRHHIHEHRHTPNKTIASWIPTETIPFALSSFLQSHPEIPSTGGVSCRDLLKILNFAEGFDEFLVAENGLHCQLVVLSSAMGYKGEPALFWQQVGPFNFKIHGSSPEHLAVCRPEDVAHIHSRVSEFHQQQSAVNIGFSKNAFVEWLAMKGETMDVDPALEELASVGSVTLSTRRKIVASKNSHEVHLFVGTDSTIGSLEEAAGCALTAVDKFDNILVATEPLFSQGFSSKEVLLYLIFLKRYIIETENTQNGTNYKRRRAARNVFRLHDAMNFLETECPRVRRHCMETSGNVENFSASCAWILISALNFLLLLAVLSLAAQFDQPIVQDAADEATGCLNDTIFPRRFPRENKKAYVRSWLPETSTITTATTINNMVNTSGEETSRHVVTKNITSPGEIRSKLYNLRSPAQKNVFVGQELEGYFRDEDSCMAVPDYRSNNTLHDFFGTDSRDIYSTLATHNTNHLHCKNKDHNNNQNNTTCSITTTATIDYNFNSTSWLTSVLPDDDSAVINVLLTWLFLCGIVAFIRVSLTDALDVTQLLWKSRLRLLLWILGGFPVELLGTSFLVEDFRCEKDLVFWFYLRLEIIFVHILLPAILLIYFNSSSFDRSTVIVQSLCVVNLAIALLQLCRNVGLKIKEGTIYHPDPTRDSPWKVTAASQLFSLKRNGVVVNWSISRIFLQFVCCAFFIQCCISSTGNDSAPSTRFTKFAAARSSFTAFVALYGVIGLEFVAASPLILCTNSYKIQRGFVIAGVIFLFFVVPSLFSSVNLRRFFTSVGAIDLATLPSWLFSQSDLVRIAFVPSILALPFVALEIRDHIKSIPRQIGLALAGRMLMCVAETSGSTTTSNRTNQFNCREAMSSKESQQ